MLRRFFCCWLAWAAMVGLGGCATKPNPTPTGAMLVVRLMTKQEPADAPSVQVSQADQAQAMASVNGLLYARVGGKSVDYLFPMPLAPGRYRLSLDNKGPPFQLHFEVPPGAPAYIGRLQLSADGTRAPTLEDQRAEDIPMLRNAVAQLREVDIGAKLGELHVERAEPTGSGVMEVVRVSESLTAQLPQAAREGFIRYLKLRSPRAFAVNDDGLFELASGKGAVDRALQGCNKQAGSMRPCRLFSVDDNATLWNVCKPAPASEPKFWLHLYDIDPRRAPPRAPVAGGCTPRP